MLVLASMEKVSVILTTYNSEKTLPMTLESILRQKGAGSAFELELIVVDDCSTDRTQHILKNKNIPFYSNPTHTGGPNKGRNLGLRKAKGSAICFIDHDDLWTPEKILIQLEALKFAPIVTTGYAKVITKTLQRSLHRNWSNGLIHYAPNNTFLNKLAKSKTGQITQLSTIMISSTLRHVEFEEEFGKLDFDWALRLFENRPSVELPDCLVTRIVDGRNLSLDRAYRESDYSFSRRMIRTYRDRYPDAVAQSERRMNGSLARYYYLSGEMVHARRYLRRSPLGIREILYYLTSFYGSGLVKRQFSVFG